MGGGRPRGLIEYAVLTANVRPRASHCHPAANLLPTCHPHGLRSLLQSLLSTQESTLIWYGTLTQPVEEVSLPKFAHVVEAVIAPPTP